jgi:hypothetical protein
MTARQFVLQALDPDTGCAVLEARFRTADLSALRAVLGEDAGDDPDLRCGYDLSDDQLAAIVQRFGVAFDPAGRSTVLAPWQSIREVPYLVHTHFELALMLDGRKPLAVFNDTYPSEWFDELVSRFDPYVADGRFVRRIVDRPKKRSREVYIALRGEEWRINAFLLLREVWAKSGWNDALERFEGSLLGYEDWQNDWWLANRRGLGAAAVAALGDCHAGTTASAPSP